MPASAIRLALLGAAAILAGCAAVEPPGVEWQRQSALDQHRYMPGPLRDRPTVVVNGGPTGGVGVAGAPPAAEQILVQGDRALLVPQEEYARLRGNPQVLGGPPAPAQPAPPMPATR